MRFLSSTYSQYQEQICDENRKTAYYSSFITRIVRRTFLLFYLFHKYLEQQKNIPHLKRELNVIEKQYIFNVNKGRNKMILWLFNELDLLSKVVVNW